MLHKARKACDQCRFRKLKCDSEYPCIRCSKLGLACSYKHTTARSRRIALLLDQQSADRVGGDSTSLSEEALSNNAPDGFTAPPGHRPSRSNTPEFDDVTLQSTVDRPTDAAIRTTQDDLNLLGSHYEASARPQHLHRTQSTCTDVSRLSYLAHTSTVTASSDATPWLAGFSRSDILPWMNIYLDRLYLTLPIVNRTTLYQDLSLGRHNDDLDFASMVLSLCALSLVQPVLREEYRSMPERLELATNMLRAAIDLRSFDFAEHANMETVIASFFMFAALFGMRLHKAAWLRLRESIECGKMIGLYQPQTYLNLTAERKEQRFRLLLILAVTERGYALQRNHSISITGKNIHDMKEMYSSISKQALPTTQGIYIHDEKDGAAVHGLLQLMRLFDAIDEAVIPCWNRSCAPTLQTCRNLSIASVERVYHSIAEAHEPDGTSPWPKQTSALDPVQWADYFVLQQWLLMRLWVSCLTHDLLESESPHLFMQPSFVLEIAERVANECQNIESDTLEIHGSGMVERIHDIGMGVIMAAQGYDDIMNSPRTRLILHTYLDLLNQFRDGGRPFSTALSTASHSFLT